MCGVAGLLRIRNEQPGSVTRDVLSAMADAMAHRGPDGSGVWIAADQNVGMSHRRLSIIDLSADAGQPMHDARSELTVVYNGEIYNHAELRQQLTKLGHTEWRTDHSDTEVLLNAYREWGVDCLSRLRGMFAFGLWDRRKKRLFLARDRIGVKPLYYTNDGPTFAFASEIKAILAVDGTRPRISLSGLRQYLGFMTTTGPETIFQGIHKLQPGHWMTIDADGRKIVHRYWDALESVNRIEDSVEQVSERLISEF